MVHQDRADLVGDACYKIGDDKTRYVLAIADSSQFSRLLARMADPEEFLSPYGLRSLSKFTKITLSASEKVGSVRAWGSRGEHQGGNSNWRGPLWFPTTYLLIHSLLRFSDALGKDFAVPRRGNRKSTRLAGEIAIA